MLAAIFATGPAVSLSKGWALQSDKLCCVIPKLGVFSSRARHFAWSARFANAASLVSDK
jgi:hypothetical protein